MYKAGLILFQGKKLKFLTACFAEFVITLTVLLIKKTETIY